MNLNKDITEYIQGAGENQIVILEKLRQLIHKSVPDTTEAIKWGFPVFAKTKDYTYMRFSKKHITLGFYNFDKIDDADSLLEGTGNTLRHIKIRTKEDIDAPLIRAWLKSIAE